MVYRFGKFNLEFNPSTGETITRYHDGNRSGCGIVSGDLFHSERLKITPALHRLAHELIHHMIGIRYFESEFGSPVIYRDAMCISQDTPAADLEEWMVTQLTYHVFGFDRDHDGRPVADALKHIQKAGINVIHLTAFIKKLLDSSKGDYQ